MNGLLLASSHENKDIKFTTKNISNTQDDLLKNQNDFFQNLMENLLHEEPESKNKKFLIAKILDLPENRAQNAEIRSLFSKEPLIKEHHIDKVSFESLIQLSALLKQHPQEPLPYFPTDSKALQTSLLDLSVQQEFREAKTVGDLLHLAKKHHISVKNFTFFKEEAAVDLHAKTLVKKINSEEILKIIGEQTQKTDKPVQINTGQQRSLTDPKHASHSSSSSSILQKLLITEKEIKKEAQVSVIATEKKQTTTHTQSVKKPETDILMAQVTSVQKRDKTVQNETLKIAGSGENNKQVKPGEQEQTTPVVQSEQPETTAKQILSTFSTDKTLKNHTSQEKIITHETTKISQLKADNDTDKSITKTKKSKTDNILRNSIQTSTLSDNNTKHSNIPDTGSPALSTPKSDLQNGRNINLAQSEKPIEIKENSSSSTSEPSLHEEKVTVSHETKTTQVHQSKPHHPEFKRTLNTFAQDFREQVENYKAPLMKIKMQLNPGNLGDVDVTLINRGNNLHVTINSNPSTIAIFSQNQTEFKNALVNMGFTGLQMSFGESKEQNRGQQHKPSSKHSERQSEEIHEIDHFEMIVPRYV